MAITIEQLRRFETKILLQNPTYEKTFKIVSQDRYEKTYRHNRRNCNVTLKTMGRIPKLRSSDATTFVGYEIRIAIIQNKIEIAFPLNGERVSILYSREMPALMLSETLASYGTNAFGKVVAQVCEKVFNDTAFFIGFGTKSSAAPEQAMLFSGLSQTTDATHDMSAYKP